MFKRTQKRSLADRHIQLFGTPPPPGAVFMPESLAQPDPRRFVDSITTYGVQQVPDISGGVLSGGPDWTRLAARNPIPISPRRRDENSR